MSRSVDGNKRIAWICGKVFLVENARVAIAAPARCRGLAVPMLLQVLHRAFEYPSIKRAELNVYTFNVAAFRAYERVGFVSEGVRRSARVSDERWDVRMMALLRADWTGREVQVTR